MTKASDNEYPSVLFAQQGSNPPTPASGFWRLFTKSGGVYAIDSAGNVVGPFAATGSQSRHGCRARHSTTQTVGSASTAPMALDTETFDTDGYHFTSAAALTGTVAKTNGSPNIVGTGTSFTTELTVNQVISIPGTATEIGVVKTITDNTHIVLWQNMANTASGQTATRRSEFVAIPAGRAGLYSVSGGLRWTTVTAAKLSGPAIYLNGNLSNGGTAIAVDYLQSVASSVNIKEVSTEYVFAEGDYIALCFVNNESGTVTITNAAEYSPFLAIAQIAS